MRSLPNGGFQPLLLLLWITLLVPGLCVSSTYEPEFDLPLPNFTAKMGTDVQFVCVVKHLGDFKVAWIRAEDKRIISWHTFLVSANHRFSVTHSHQTYILHIRNVQQNDSGSYMCQVNTEPQKSLVGSLDVVIPADIIDEETSSDVVVTEGQSTILKCKASGVPQPKVRWRRQDGRPLPISRELLNSIGQKVVDVWEGEKLPLKQLQRKDTGAYLCIANNSVPPAISKRIDVKVHFHPLIKIKTQLVASPVGFNVSLECAIEGLPKPFMNWRTRDDKDRLILPTEGKYEVETIPMNDYTFLMRLTIANLRREDFTDYNCSVSNSLGQASATIKLQKINPPPTQRTTSTTTTTSTTPIPTTTHSWRLGSKYNPDGKKNHRGRKSGSFEDIENSTPSSREDSDEGRKRIRYTTKNPWIRAEKNEASGIISNLLLLALISISNIIIINC